MAESLGVHARDLADYFNVNILDCDRIVTADILDALASLGLTLVEDPIADSSYSYYESVSSED